jgi:hypothetical protein
LRALSILTDKHVKLASVGKHNDGGGLWLIKREDGGAQWVYRFSLHSRRPEMGLGTYPNITLASARKLATRWRQVLSEGKNPIAERQRLSRENAKSKPTLNLMANETFEAIKRKLVRDGKDGRWDGPLRNSCSTQTWSYTN